MNTLDKTEWEILNATADDCENLEQICRQVSSVLGEPVAGSQATPLSQVADDIHDLVERKLLAIVMDENGDPWKDPNDLSYVWRAWFRMTPQGRDAWKSFEQVMKQENGAAR